MKKIIKINLWDLVDINVVNDTLDANMKDGFATDISYDIKKSSKNGDLTIEATFTKEKI